MVSFSKFTLIFAHLCVLYIFFGGHMDHEDVHGLRSAALNQNDHELFVLHILGPAPPPIYVYIAKLNSQISKV